MKIAILTLALLSTFGSPLAQAKGERSGGLPSTAKLLFQASGRSSTFAGDASLAQSVAHTQQEAKRLIDTNGCTQDCEYATPLNVEYECSAIYLVWDQAESNESRGCGAGSIFTMGQTACLRSIDTRASVYCQPRDFRQKVVISAMKACEKEPKPECMSNEYMEKFDKIQQTSYHNINRPR